MNLIKKNAECLLTLVGVILYENLKSVTSALGIGFVAPMFGIVLTIVGVAMTLIAKKGSKGTAVALAIHAILWILKGAIGWIAGVAIAFFIIFRVVGKPETRGRETEENRQSGGMTFSQLPERLSSGTATYFRTHSSDIGVGYVNEKNPGDTIWIDNIYSSTSSEVSTNAGHFFFL